MNFDLEMGCKVKWDKSVKMHFIFCWILRSYEAIFIESIVGMSQ